VSDTRRAYVRTLWFAAAVLVGLLVAAYANHFDNTFHFDDSHAIVDNPSVRSLGNIGRFFVDATTFSILPENQTYRPVLQTTLALDYWMAGGYSPRVFQITSFIWFLIQLGLMYLLFDALLERAGTRGSKGVALAATALYGLHPVGAETLNYIIQRGEILVTAGVVAALALYVRRPAWRRFGLFLLPAILAALAKPIAMVFPVLLFAYIWLYERDRVRDVVPAVVAIALTAIWTWTRTPATYTTSGGQLDLYWLTQGWVALQYFRSAFAPLWLSADHDSALLQGLSDSRAVVGLAFVIGIAWLALRMREHRAVAFGLWWFLIALAPTSLTPLAEVSNDHRMFFPFVGLALAAAATAVLLWSRLPARWQKPVVALSLVALILIAEAAGVHARNRVWQTSERLWHDVTLKSPGNSRGHMNYAVALMARGDYDAALASLARARALAPTYPLVHVNLGIVLGALKREREADEAFRAAIALAPQDWRSRMFYGRWLTDVGRFQEAVAELTRAASANPLDPEPPRLLDRALNAWADNALAISLAEYNRGEFRACLTSVRQGLAIRPQSAGLHNNAAACHNSLGEWDAGIAAAREALRLSPDLAIAANNLAFALERKARK
jgi:tetratricopeptide (TPR) repeat protein